MSWLVGIADPSVPGLLGLVQTPLKTHVKGIQFNLRLIHFRGESFYNRSLGWTFVGGPGRMSGHLLMHKGFPPGSGLSNHLSRVMVGKNNPS